MLEEGRQQPPTGGDLLFGPTMCPSIVPHQLAPPKAQSVSGLDEDASTNTFSLEDEGMCKTFALRVLV